MGRSHSDSSAGMPAEFISTVNLMAHPLAGAAAMSALGFGMASHMLGLWMGAVAGSLEAASKLSSIEMPTGARTGVGPTEPATRARTPKQAAETAPRDVEGVVSLPRVRTAQPKRRVAAKAAKDDLKSIPGIGPKLEQVLNRLGYENYAQLAALGPAEIERLDAQLGLNGRIGRDDWIGHASKLSGGAR